MSEMQRGGTVSGPWAFGAFTAICVAATSFTLGGDTAKTLRDQSIEANLLAEGVNSEWINLCQNDIKGADQAPSPKDVAKGIFLKVIKDKFPRADTSNFDVSGVLVCPLPDPSSSLADALAMVRVTAGLDHASYSYDVLPNSSLIDWFSRLASNQSQQPSTDTAGASDSTPSDAERVAHALAEGAKIYNVSVFYSFNDGDGYGDYTEDYPDTNVSSDFGATRVAREGPYKDPGNFSIHIDYYDPHDQSNSEDADPNAAPVTQLVTIKLSDQNGIFAYYPPSGLVLQSFYYEKRVRENPQYSWYEGPDNGNHFEFPALAEREDELRNKTVSDVALQLNRELADKGENVSIFGIDFSLVQFCIFSIIALVISLLVIARSISLAGIEALPPVVRDMPRLTIGLILVLVVIAWPSVILIFFGSQFCFAYPDLEASIEWTSCVWCVAASLVLWVSVWSARRRAHAAQKEIG